MTALLRIIRMCKEMLRKRIAFTTELLHHKSDLYRRKYLIDLSCETWRVLNILARQAGSWEEMPSGSLLISMVTSWRLQSCDTVSCAKLGKIKCAKLGKIKVCQVGKMCQLGKKNCFQFKESDASLVTSLARWAQRNVNISRNVNTTKCEHFTKNEQLK